jgi:hypothetical protein
MQLIRFSGEIEGAELATAAAVSLSHPCHVGTPEALWETKMTDKIA